MAIAVMDLQDPKVITIPTGFEDNNGVIVIAATNDPNILDEALMREGRFDTKISIRAPSLKVIF